MAKSEHPPQAPWGYTGDVLDEICGLDVGENDGGSDEPLEDSAALTAAFQTHSAKYDWGSPDDALWQFLNQSEHLSDDAHPPKSASPSVAENNAMDLPEIDASQAVDTPDSDGSGDARIRSPFALRLVAHSESPQPISNTDVDWGLDYKPSTPVAEDSAAPTSPFHTRSAKHDWGTPGDALWQFLNQSEHLSDDAHPPKSASPSVTGNNAMDLPDIDASRAVDTPDSDGSGDARIRSPFALRLVAHSESPQPISNTDVDWGLDYKPSTPVAEDSAAPTSPFHTRSAKHDWGTHGDALWQFLNQSEHLSDDAHPPKSASPSVTGNNAMDLPEIDANQEIDTLDSDGSGDAGIRSQSSQLPANQEPPPHSTSDSYDDGGSDYAPSTYKPLSKPSTTIPEGHHPLPRLSSSKEELYIDALLANPYLWSNAYRELSSVAPGYQLHAAVLDFYLTQEWYAVAQETGPDNCSAFYLDRSTVRHLVFGTFQHTLLKHLLLPNDRIVKPRPVLFIQGDDDGGPSLLTLLDYNSNQVFLFGKYNRTVNDTLYTSWDHSCLWNAIAHGLGWVEKGDKELSAFNLDWVQVGVEGGPQMAAVVHHVLECGWRAPRIISQFGAPATLTCTHLMRERVFYQVLKASCKYYSIWYMSQDEDPYDITPPQRVLDDMMAQPYKFQWIREIALRLDAKRRLGCCSCNVEEDDPHYQGSDATDSDPPPRLSTMAPFKRHKHLGSFISGHPAQQKQRAATPIDIHTAEHDGPPQPAPDSDDDYDDYDDAPIVQTQDKVSESTWSFDGYGKLILETCWSTWIDRGFRLKRRFFSMFPDTPPAQHIEHLLPIAAASTASEESSDDNRSSGTSSSFQAVDSTSSSSNVSVLPPSFGISIPDPPKLRLGLQGMLDEAGPLENTNESHNVFICGKERTGTLFYVDPTLDETRILSTDILQSPDLDSLIYVTDHLKFKAAMHLHLTPLLGGRAPFWKSNHVYVNVLSPPMDLGSRSHVTKPYTLNQIPHMHFGQLGTGSIQFNVYVFFPRMIQKHPKRKFMLNMIPLPVQELWLESAVIPAAREVFIDGFPGTMEYVPWSLEQLRLKKGGDRGPKTIPMSPSCLDRLQAILRSRLKNHPDLLQRFSSFFFVLDSRGIKLLSKQYCLETQTQAVLQDMLPFLDLEHMMDRQHGELVLDLGITYHPPTHGAPMVGLWKLSEVNRSYEVMGSRKGKVYSGCTLSEYGGRQAPMGKRCQMHTQLLSRSTYNLVFEVVRTSGQTQYLCNDTDAAKGGDRFITACNGWKELFRQAMSKSFGVRDEVRGSAVAIFDLFGVASEKATIYLHSDPILWVPSKTYFSWILRRFMELQHVHQRLSIVWPQNYGILNLIITYLMRYVMVTPQVKHKCLTESLRSLRFDGIINRFGMFFLHDFDLLTCHLGEIDEHDPQEVKDLGGHAPNHSGSRTSRPLQLCIGHDDEEFPWGRILSWQRVQDLVDTECCGFLRPWEFTHEQEEDNVSKKLFKVFTRDMWLSLGSHVVESNRLPNPKSLEEAMRTWTPRRVEQILGKNLCQFLASTHGLRGRYPKNVPSKSFAEMRNIFFPGPDVPLQRRSLWNAYVRDGAYIQMYHDYLTRLSDDEVETLHEELDAIFSNLQCLPPSRPPNKSGTVIWSAVGGKVQFITNSLFYRVEEICGKMKGNKTGPVRPQTSLRQLEARIRTAHGVGPSATGSRRRIRKRALKTRNHRNPPVKKKPQLQDPIESDMEGDDDTSSTSLSTCSSTTSLASSSS